MGSNRHACNATQLRKARSVAMHLRAFPLEYLAAPCARKVCSWRDHMIWGEIVWGGLRFFHWDWELNNNNASDGEPDVTAAGRRLGLDRGGIRPIDRHREWENIVDRLGEGKKQCARNRSSHPRRSIDNGPAGRALRKRTVLLCCSSSFSLFSFSDDERHFDSSSSISYIVGEREKKGISMTMHMSWLLAIYTRSLAMPIANRVWTNLSYAPYCL